MCRGVPFRYEYLHMIMYDIFFCFSPDKYAVQCIPYEKLKKLQKRSLFWFAIRNTMGVRFLMNKSKTNHPMLSGPTKGGTSCFWINRYCTKTKKRY